MWESIGAGSVARVASSRRVATVLALAVFGVAWAGLHVGYFERAHVRFLGDVEIYQGWGENMRQGELPYRDFAVAYPPGALPVFVLPTFASSYDGALEAGMAVCGLLTVLFVALARPPRGGLGLVALLPLLVGALSSTRYDLWPAMLTAAAVAAFAADRHRIGFGMLGLAVAAKLYPAVLVPLAVVWTLRRRGRRELLRAGAIGLLAAVLPFVPFLILAPHGLWESVRQQLTRPLQVESLGAAVMIFFHKAGIVNSFGSANVTGQAERPLAIMLTAALVFSLLYLWSRFAEGPVGPERLFRHAAACLCAFVAFDKVLSPQYLIWLVPAVALVRGGRGAAARATLVVALVLTQLWEPDHYRAYVATGSYAWAVLLRDLVLVGLVGVLALPTAAFGRRAPSAATHAE